MRFTLRIRARGETHQNNCSSLPPSLYPEVSACREPRVHEEGRVCTRRAACARGEPRVHEESRVCTRRAACARGEPRVHEESRVCTRRAACARGSLQRS
ncbi:hypothetical protein KUCAC02_022259 [Chaenocephalus aceratus]|nr:hypothetical protein KUCAC02_022259 [Chaenocephalus aceratus]